MWITNILVCFLSITTVLCDVPDVTSSEIVGGREVDISKHPYIVALRKLDKTVCGASIIQENYILTAAHCIHPNKDNPTRFSICAGHSEREKCLQKRTVKKIYMHENYDSDNLLHDIALLRLKEPLEFGNTIKLIMLANKRFVLSDNDVVVASGWGRTGIYFFSGASNALKKVNLKIFNHEECKKQYASFNNVTDNMICAGGSTSAVKDTCQGDSGGPLVYNGILVGVTSWGDGCAQPGIPGVYTSVSKYRKWIRDIADV